MRRVVRLIGSLWGGRTFGLQQLWVQSSCGLAKMA